MLAETNRERLLQEVTALVLLITRGREYYFKQTGYSLSSSEDFVNHWICKEIFNTKHPELMQLELNIQLLYIKLSAFYAASSIGENKKLKEARNAFAHDLTNLIFNSRVKYNFFLHKVSENMKIVQFLFYEEEEELESGNKQKVRTVDLNLDKDINNFFAAVNGEVPTSES